jgi:hypothetical protein
LLNFNYVSQFKEHQFRFKARFPIAQSRNASSAQRARDLPIKDMSKVVDSSRAGWSKAAALMKKSVSFCKILPDLCIHFGFSTIFFLKRTGSIPKQTTRKMMMLNIQMTIGSSKPVNVHRGPRTRRRVQNQGHRLVREKFST